MDLVADTEILPSDRLLRDVDFFSNLIKILERKCCSFTSFLFENIWSRIKGSHFLTNSDIDMQISPLGMSQRVVNFSYIIFEN